MTSGSSTGILPSRRLLDAFLRNEDLSDKTIYELEGPMDVAAAVSVAPEIYAFTNSNGAGETPKQAIIDLLCRCNVTRVRLVFDCDKPGQQGATGRPGRDGKISAGWGNAIRARIEDTKNVRLPYEVVERQGKDLRDWLNDGGSITELDKLPAEDVQPIAIGPDQEHDDQADEPQPIAEAVDDPHRLAKAFLARDGYRPGAASPTADLGLWFYRNEWYRYQNGAYRKLELSDVKRDIDRSVKEEFDEAYRWEYQTLRRQGDDEKADKLRVKKASRTVKANVRDAAESLAHAPSHQEAPFWLDGNGFADASELIVARNKIVHLPSLADDKPSAIEPTKNLFTVNALPFDFDPEATCPQWDEFLGGIFANDPGSIEALQRWFGYCLSPAMWLHKMLSLIGPARAGKGTIASVLRALVGPDNTSATRLGLLAGRFGMEPLLGKLVAIIGDARLSGRVDDVAITETLLGIVGGDPQDIDRKSVPALASVPMSVRFVLLSNSLPRLSDSSKAIASRCIILRLTESFCGREDRHLLERLMGELPGILNWAIRGWESVHESRNIPQPESGEALVESLESSASPITDFANECCIVAESHDNKFEPVEQSALYQAWRVWCLQEGRNPGTKSQFETDLVAALPTVMSTRPESDGKQGDKEGVRLFVSENSREEAERWLADHPQSPGTETAIAADPLGPDAPFPTVPGPDMEISYYQRPQCRIVIREAGQEYGRTVAIDEWSRQHLEAWLARNPQPAGAEALILDDGEEPPWPAPQDASTIKFVPPSRELSHLLGLARRGEWSSMPAVERQARNVVLAVLENARDLDGDSIEFAIPELIRWTQEGEDSRDEIREVLEVSQ